MEPIYIVCIILAACLVFCVLALLVFAYNQLLQLNEVNKRLLLLSSDAINNDRNSMAELSARIIEQERVIDEALDSTIGEAFNPHEALDDMNDFTL